MQHFVVFANMIPSLTFWEQKQKEWAETNRLPAFSGAFSPLLLSLLMLKQQMLLNLQFNAMFVLS